MDYAGSGVDNKLSKMNREFGGICISPGETDQNGSRRGSKKW